ncbi:hypothetical protein VOLCADRAFT_100118 [Volvox carteri f. nagariensis]|uniref:Uncharacterized protein n=1 Tax=Volvox carteri f. nagariensis TaxID=3068 RepID=D8UJG5_VOLCA|nr:uncharacterized protein VOLCADRAFT_100118 [Volvox carteri f. nagariensis]EFJ40140.1 hypothetical protein VOLCADRAFT_100118 [Volvox carteri f. nagariensis]|eukprot:XP_002958797.1 hypothetical protein VOLCADRAFT_100118 [Volvox carteri f. nagariensis]
MSDQSPASKRLRLGSLADGFRSGGRIRPFADLSTGRAAEQQQHAAAQQTAMQINSAGPAEAAAADTQLEGQHQGADASAAEVRERWRRQKAAQRAAALPELRLLQRQQDAARHAAARADPEVRAQQRMHDTAQHAAARADPEVRVQQQLRDAAQHAAARADPEVRALQQQRNTAQHAAARADPAVRVLQQQRNTAQHAAACADPEVRALQQQRNTAQHAAARADLEVRALQQQRNTAQHAAARADPEVRVLQQQRNTAQHAAARADPEVRVLQQQRNTARHAAARQVQQQNQQATPKDTLLARMHRLLRFANLHGDDAIDLPEFLLALPEGRVQDLPGGQLPPDRQVPHTVQLHCASTMAAALRRRMPSRVCAVCSEVCSEDQSTVLHWMEIPNVDILRADVMCTASRRAFRRRPCAAGASPGARRERPPGPGARRRCCETRRGKAASATQCDKLFCTVQLWTLRAIQLLDRITQLRTCAEARDSHTSKCAIERAIQHAIRRGIQRALWRTIRCALQRVLRFCVGIIVSPASKRLRLGSLADGFRGRIRPFADLSTGRAPEQQQHAAAQQTAVRINSAGPAEAAAADTQLEGQHQDADPSAAEVRERWRRQKAAQRAAALPELRLLQRQQDAARHAAARADPEVRALQQQRNTAQHAAARADPEVRALQQQRNTAQHAAARADPEAKFAC